MIPANLSLIPLSHERRAAMQAIAEVEKKYERGVHIAEFAYAHAFFRILNGSKRVTVKDIGWFSPGMTAQNLRGKKQDWLAAIDRLIESRGACCWLPCRYRTAGDCSRKRSFRRQSVGAGKMN